MLKNTTPAESKAPASGGVIHLHDHIIVGLLIIQNLIQSLDAAADTGERYHDSTSFPVFRDPWRFPYPLTAGHEATGLSRRLSITGKIAMLPTMKNKAFLKNLNI